MPRIRAPEPATARISKATVERAQRDERKAMKAAGVKPLTADSYQNFAQSIGLGTDNALSGSSYGFNPITRVRTLLEWIYRGSWFGGMAIDIPADDMTRAGIEIQSEMPPNDVEGIQKGLVELGVWREMNDVLKWGRLYGGCLGVMMIDGQDPATPLNIDRIGKGAFKGLLVLDRWMVEPDLSDLVTEQGPEIGLPKFYRVVADAPAFRLRRIHHSRCMRVEGIRLPYWQRLTENLWGLSIFERLYDRMVAFDSATMGMAQLIYKCYVRTYKLKGLRRILAEGGDLQRALMGWVEMTRRLQGNEGITLIDADDDFVPTTQTTFTGISEAVMQLAMQLSGALQVPLTRLLGQSPAGLNSTGESDLKTYREGIKQKQELEVRMPLTKIIKVTAKSRGIVIPDNFSFTFRELGGLDEVQKAEVFAKASEGIRNLEADGLIQLVTALKELRQLRYATGYMSNITDEEIADAEDAPPRPRETEEPEADPAGAAGSAGVADPAGARDAGPAMRFDNRHDVRCGAVSSRHDPGLNYIDRRIPRHDARLMRLDGRPADLWKYLGIHEQDERAAMAAGMPYPRAHIDVATPAERAAVEADCGRKGWPIYTDIMDGFLSHIEHEPVRNPPPDPHVDPDKAVGHHRGSNKRTTARDEAASHLQASVLPASVTGHFADLQVAIETPKGVMRRGRGWAVPMPADYGYIRRVASAEGPEEWMDCFVGDDPRAPDAWIVDAVDPRTGRFDEHKVMLGFGSEAAALDCFARAYGGAGGRDRIGGVTRMNLGNLKTWLATGDFSKPLAEGVSRLRAVA